MGMGDEPARPDVVQVICEPRPASEVQVLVVVLGEKPAPSPSPVALAVSGPDLDWKIVPRGLERELDETTIAIATEIQHVKVAPGVEEVRHSLPAVSNLALRELGDAERRAHRAPAGRRRQGATSREGSTVTTGADASRARSRMTAFRGMR